MVSGTDPLESNDARPGDEATVVKLVDDVELAQSGLDVQLVHGPALVVELHGALLTVSDATSEDQLPAREADSSGAITVFVMICVTVPLVMVMVAQGEVTAGLAVIVSLALDEPVETNVPDGSFDPVPVASVGSRTDPELRLVLPAARVELELPLVVEPAGEAVGADGCGVIVLFPTLGALPVDVILSDGPGDEDDSSPWKSVFVSSGSSEVALDRTVLFAVGNSGVPVGTTVGVKVVTIAPERLEIGRIVRFPALVGTLVLVAFGRGSGVGTIVFGVPTPVPLTPPELVALGSGNGVRFEGVGTPTPVVDDGLMFSELRPVPATELERVLLDNGDVTDWVRAVLVVLDKTEVGTVIFAMLVPVPAMVRDPETVELGIGKGVAPGVIDKGMLVADVLAFGEPTPGPGPDVVEVAFGNGKGVSADGNGDKAVDVGALAFVALMLVLTVASERLAFEGENLVELMGLREGDKVVEALASTVLRPVPAMVPDAVLFERGNGADELAGLGARVCVDDPVTIVGSTEVIFCD
ncbi:K(+)/H(+) antiporter 1 [Verticillium dahliae VDG2]|nr:K(+)/H(+) antiporter 1 [Verticillium dahliae VDG2]